MESSPLSRPFAEQKGDCMQLGIFAPIFGRLSLDAMLQHLSHHPAITAIELGTGGFPGSDHVEVDALLSSKDRAREFLHAL